MIGLLLALAIQGPFALSESGNCNKTLNSSSSINTEEKSSVNNIWESQKYAIIAIIISCFFALGNVLLIAFVNEKGTFLYLLRLILNTNH